MRKLLIIMLSLTIPLGGFYAYSVYNTETDDLVVKLREISFLPLNPPVNFHTVGALYYIEPDLRAVHVICSAPEESLKKYIHESRSVAIGGARTLQGTYTSNIKASASKLIDGKSSLDDKRLIKVRYELKDLLISEIELGASRDISELLLKTESCDKAVKEYLRMPGYICQNVQLLVASAVFELNSEVDTKAAIDVDMKKALENEIASNFQAGVIEGRSSSTSGQGLQWGIQMAPLCITPLTARYQRTIPRNNFDKILNFIKFNILEPILPPTVEPILPAPPTT